MCTLEVSRVCVMEPLEFLARVGLRETRPSFLKGTSCFYGVKL